MTDYKLKQAKLVEAWDPARTDFRLAKRTISNLFRYEGQGAARAGLSLQSFDEIIALDTDTQTLEVEGLATFERIVRYTLERGFLPLVAPELKHITIGGAVVGIGIESTCFKHGFVHDGLIEADVLLPDGRIVTCTANNAYADLFRALPNSYGTLGYILRAKIKLQRAAPSVRLAVTRYDDAGAYLEAMREAATTQSADFIEGLVFQDARYYLMLGSFTPALQPFDDIVRQHVFYRLVTVRSEINLRTYDYIFRYDPEWFWNIPDGLPYRLFRRHAPLRWRNSSFYTRYTARKARVRAWLPGAEPPATEPLIQDWQVPWSASRQLLEHLLENVPLDGRPCAAVPIMAKSRPTLYPIKPGELYFNLGCYCHIRKAPDAEPYHYTRLMDRRCFELGGIKMLYSSSFLEPAEFDRLYDGDAYRRLKAKYDPDGRARTLFQKVAMSPATSS